MKEEAFTDSGFIFPVPLICLCALKGIRDNAWKKLMHEHQIERNGHKESGVTPAPLLKK